MILLKILDKCGQVYYILFNNTCHASPWKRKSVGFFMPQNPCRYTKKALSIDEQLSLLKSRKLIVNDPDRVCRYLRFIGYFRLSKYFAIFQKSFDPNPQFKPDTTFDDILDVYIFDRKLRLLIMDAIERIEVAVRATISNTMSVHSGGHWYLDRKHFRESYNYNVLKKKLNSRQGLKILQGVTNRVSIIMKHTMIRLCHQAGLSERFFLQDLGQEFMII